MRRVAVVGAGQSAYGDFVDLGPKELFAKAYKEMVASLDKGYDPREVEMAYIGSLGVGGAQIGQPAPLLMGHVGLGHVPSLHVESACASGAMALVQAVLAIASGRCDVALAGGLEKMRDLSNHQAKYWLGVSGDTEYERLAGLTFAGIFAVVATRYMHEYGLTREHLARVAVKNHKHGALNPKAHFRKEVALDRVMGAPEVAWPLGVFDCCPTSDGAAVALLVAEDRVHEFTDRPVWVAGVGTGNDYLAIHDRESVTSFAAVRRAAKQAYEMAGIGPYDVDLAEVHDCFTISEIVAYGDLGFCEPGQAGRLLEEGVTSLGGPLPVNVSGGLKAKGHPIGATGVGQTCEVFHQLRGTADRPERQVVGATTALTHNLGGSGGSAAVMIYQTDLRQKGGRLA